uniref:LYK3/RLK10-like LysM domain-containing protein n=1 Tax=Oryza brachyantha TaxID=4533 RepID=J3MZ39_ORYBR
MAHMAGGSLRAPAMKLGNQLRKLSVLLRREHRTVQWVAVKLHRALLHVDHVAGSPPALGSSKSPSTALSCGDERGSPRFGLFLTYPLWDGETLASAAAQYGFSSPELVNLIRTYNPGMERASGKGIVFIPVKDPNGSYDPLKSGVGTDSLLRAFVYRMLRISRRNSLSGGAIAGIVIVCIAVFIVGIWLIAIFCRWQKFRKATLPPSPEEAIHLGNHLAKNMILTELLVHLVTCLQNNGKKVEMAELVYGARLRFWP